MNKIKISDSYTCPVCMGVSNATFETTKELQLIEENCPKCYAELKLSVWVKNNQSMMLSVKTSDQQLEWIQDTNGNLVLHHNGKPIKATTIPNMMRNYTGESNGELVEVNVEGLKQHIEKEYSSFM